MYKVDTLNLKPGMKISKDIYNNSGAKLLKAGTRLTNKYINKLINLGINFAYIDSGFLNEQELPEDVISEETRMEAINQVENILLSTRESGKLVIDAQDFYSTINNLINQLLTNSNLMFNLVDLRTLDQYTFAHSVNVSVLAIMTGITLNYNKAELFELGLGALLHDLGKMKIPDSILNKPDTLTPEEFNIMKKHPYYSFKLIQTNERLSDISSIIAYQHHEAINGTGYPRGIYGKNFSEYAQITAIADKFDALTANRVYRKAFPFHEAFEMCAASGDFLIKHNIVKAFLYNLAAYPSGSLVQLNNGQIGVVIDTPKGYSLFPRVRLLFDKNHRPLSKPHVISLVEQQNLFVVKVLSEEETSNLTDIFNG